MEALKNREFDDDCRLTVLFTAGTAVVAVCLKRAVVVLLLKQWQLWVFLLLNVLLLAILFTPICSAPTENPESCREKVRVMAKRGRKKINRPHLRAVEVEEETKIAPFNKSKETVEMNSVVNKQDDPIEVDTADACGLSDEELNERVEKFIASFRQQLVLDARKMREI